MSRSAGNVSISGCYNAGTIQAVVYVGGIAAQIQGATAIDHCYNVGTLIADAYYGFVGGLIATPATAEASLFQCYTANLFHCAGAHVGAVTGTISQHYRFDAVFYEASQPFSWCGGALYGWDGASPKAYNSYPSLLHHLDSAFQSGRNALPRLQW